MDFEELTLHVIRGKNVVMSDYNTVAERTSPWTIGGGGYVFSSRPIDLNEKVVLQVFISLLCS